MIVGGDATWLSGAIYPTVGGEIYVGGTFNAPGYLQSYVENAPCHGCTDAAFNAVKSCYDNVVDTYSHTPTNGYAQIIPFTGGSLEITCNDANDLMYYIDIPDSVLSQASQYQLVNCNMDASYVLVISGTGDVNFHGSPFPPVPNGATYVIDCSEVDRGVTLSVGVNGGIIAPDCSHLQETGGAVWGKVVASDITYMIQFNRPCAYNIAV